MPGKAISSGPEPKAPAGLDGAPRPAEPDVFAEPWQAEAFALVVGLHERGVFSWNEWARHLGAEVGRPDAAADASDYYRHWLSALEKLLAAKGVVEAREVDALAAAWQRAAIATPHGKPIVLDNDPQRAAGHGRAYSGVR